MNKSGLERREGFSHWLLAAGLVLLAAGLLVHAGAVAEGVRAGLRVCAGVLIPSLFPFMVLAGFLAATDCARVLSLPLGPLTRRVFKLPRELGIVVLLSLIGGYPVGAKMIADLQESGRIDSATASRMLCFCVNAGPSFVVTAVGAGMFGSPAAGLLLLAAQILATLLIGFAVSFRASPPPKSLPTHESPPPVVALVRSVSGATTAMFTMCAFAVLGSALRSLLESWCAASALAAVLPVGEGTVTAVLSGLLEVTSGCVAASALGGLPAFALTSVMLSFGGLSVLFQIMAMFKGREISFLPLLLSRVAHAGLSTAMATPIYRAMFRSQTAFLPATPAVAHTDHRTVIMTGCLLAMCVIFTWAVRVEK